MDVSTRALQDVGSGDDTRACTCGIRCYHTTKEPLQKILLGKKYGVAKWLEEGYRALILRWEGLSEEDRNALDASTQLKILHLRDKAWEGLLRSAWGRHDDANRSKKQMRALGGESEQTAAIREVFGHELKSEQ